MYIKLSPKRCDTQLVASVEGNVITVNGVRLDFSPLQEGETLPYTAINNQWVTGDVERIDGDIHITLFLPHGCNAPESTRFPAALEAPMYVASGEVPLPEYDTVIVENEGGVDE